MDPTTHGLLGATLAQAGFAGRLGWQRAAFIGALGAMLPDIDVVAAPFGGPLGEFRFHRAATHAIWVAPLLGPLLGQAAWSFARRRAAATGQDAPPPARTFQLLLTLALLTHPLLDLMTTYGIQIFWPLRARLALDAVPIVDVLYTGMLVLALVAGRFLHTQRPQLSRRVAALALAATSGYLAYGFALNREAAAVARQELSLAGFSDARVDAYPTLLQPWLRRIVARRGQEVRVGLLSVGSAHPIAWRGFEERPLGERMSLSEAPDAELFLWFAMGQVTWRVVKVSGREYLELEDLRFAYGQQPDQGLWGVRFAWDGRALGPAERFDRPRPALAPLLSSVWGATFNPP